MKRCKEDVTALQLRLKKIVGQLNGVQKMLEADAPCEDIITQMNAANGALHRLSFMILDGHLRHCVREGIEKGNADETIESFAEALESFSKTLTSTSRYASEHLCGAQFCFSCQELQDDYPCIARGNLV